MAPKTRIPEIVRERDALSAEQRALDTEMRALSDKFGVCVKRRDAIEAKLKQLDSEFDRLLAKGSTKPQKKTRVKLEQPAEETAESETNPAAGLQSGALPAIVTEIIYSRPSKVWHAAEVMKACVERGVEATKNRVYTTLYLLTEPTRARAPILVRAGRGYYRLANADDVHSGAVVVDKKRGPVVEQATDVEERLRAALEAKGPLYAGHLGLLDLLIETSPPGLTLPEINKRLNLVRGQATVMASGIKTEARKLGIDPSVAVTMSRPMKDGVQATRYLRTWLRDPRTAQQLRDTEPGGKILPLPRALPLRPDPKPNDAADRKRASD